MTREEKIAYAKQYRAEGFAAIVDRRHYQKHAAEIRERKRRAYWAKKLLGENAKGLHSA